MPKPIRRTAPVTFKFIEEQMETARAHLLVMETGEEVWVPKSQIKINWETGEVTMPRWLAEEKELLRSTDTSPAPARLQ